MTGFPFNFMHNPMYNGSSIIFLAHALWYVSFRSFFAIEKAGADHNIIYNKLRIKKKKYKTKEDERTTTTTSNHSSCFEQNKGTTFLSFCAHDCLFFAGSAVLPVLFWLQLSTLFTESQFCSKSKYCFSCFLTFLRSQT